MAGDALKSYWRSQLGCVSRQHTKQAILSRQYNGTVYYYVTNLQGDVMHLVDGNGSTAASYTYDPYGKVLTATGVLASINPLRYRGYYYDTETGLYYLQSRYYDPAICRFINADAYASTGQGILGNNMFAYCNNSPVAYVDRTGQSLTLSYDDMGDPLSGITRNDGFGGGSIAGGFVGTVVILDTLVASGDRSESETEAQTIAPDPSSQRIYTVYFMYAAGRDENVIVYVGRVKTEHARARFDYHKTKGRLLAYQIDGLTRDECRGLEQIGMVYFHAINAANAVSNKIRGVSPRNASRFQYFQAAAEYITTFSVELFPSYIANWSENEFLNGGL